MVVATLPPLTATCLGTDRILSGAGLTGHPRVVAIALHGSRGPAGSYRFDSDVGLILSTMSIGATTGEEKTECPPKFCV